MTLASRNDSLGFAHRTQKNLTYVEAAFREGADVHVVTQIVNSSLGLIIFPWAEPFDQRIQQLRLDELEVQGWPNWEITKGSCATLGQLLHRLRNGLAHRNVSFSSDSREAEDVTIEVWDTIKKNGEDERIVHWAARIQSDQLRRFSEKLTNLVDQTIG
jgi:HEPN pEK499 p136